MNDEERFLEWWEETTHASSYADTPSGDGPVTFFYFAERPPADVLVSALDQELPRLQIGHVDVGIDHWRDDQARWTDESETSDDEDDDELRAARSDFRWRSREWASKDADRERAAPDDENWLEKVIEALIRVPFPPI